MLKMPGFNTYIGILGCLLTLQAISCSKDWTEEMFPYKWNEYSKQRLSMMLNRKFNGNVAKNLVLYLGDGMGISTVTVTFNEI